MSTRRFVGIIDGLLLAALVLFAAWAGATPARVSAATGSKFALLPPDNATGNFTKVVQRVPVRLKVKEGLGPDAELRPGMSVTVKVDTKAAAGKC